MQQRPSESLWQEFGAWIKGRRESKRLSQHEAAKGAGIDRQQWYRIESGKSGTKRDTVIAMANAVSADVSEALRRAGFAIKEEGDFDIIIADDVRIAMLGASRFTEEDKKRFEIAFRAAYETALRMIAAEKE